MKTIIIASNNQGKITEMSNLLKDFDVEIKGLKDVGITELPEETGTTFAENSLIKSNFVFEKTGLPALADDSGLGIDCFNGFPGLFSARFADAIGGYPATFEALNKIILPSNKKIYFTCCISYTDKNIKETFEGRVDGTFTYPAKGEGGFGYDPIFQPDGFDKTFSELGIDIKQKISHRTLAMQKFLTFYHSI
ncbi:MAG: RdgB/HAM1 family non-canonical purine NTP pyrophosphatase [Rickettsiales bacterium]|nr:MAG: RdgB/HAM1 family non-canonical purine NTP pyrophosphatase [Rickettsiales bacterium]